MNNKKITFACIDELILQDKSSHPQPINTLLPDWYKNFPTNIKNNYHIRLLNKVKTIKHCPSFVDIFKYGYVIVAPVDIVLKYSKNNKDYYWELPYLWKTYQDVPQIVPHLNEQFIDYLPSNSPYNFIFKINMPFSVYTPKDYICLQIPYPYSFNNDWTSLYGKFNSSKVHELNVQIAHTSKDEEILIKKGQPLCVYIPIKKETLSMEVVNYTKRKDLQNRFNKYKYVISSKFKHTYKDL